MPPTASSLHRLKAESKLISKPSFSKKKGVGGEVEGGREVNRKDAKLVQRNPNMTGPLTLWNGVKRYSLSPRYTVVILINATQQF